IGPEGIRCSTDDSAHLLPYYFHGLPILYGAYVRPLLEHANPVVYSGRTKDVILIERVQRAATKMVAGLKSMDYETRLAVLDLFPLEYRRLRGDLILTYALFEHGLANRFFTVDPANTRRGHERCGFPSADCVQQWSARPDHAAELENGDRSFNPESCLWASAKRTELRRLPMLHAKSRTAVASLTFRVVPTPCQIERLEKFNHCGIIAELAEGILVGILSQLLKCLPGSCTVRFRNRARLSVSCGSMMVLVDRSLVVKDGFYQNLSRLLRSVKGTNIVILATDMSAQLGRPNSDEAQMGGGFGVASQRTDNGERLLRLHLVSTDFQHERSYQVTRAKPDMDPFR
ncbi:pol-related protein, partial [Clonorchis sinensis]